MHPVTGLPSALGRACTSCSARPPSRRRNRPSTLASTSASTSRTFGRPTKLCRRTRLSGRTRASWYACVTALNTCWLLVSLTCLLACSLLNFEFWIEFTQIFLAGYHDSPRTVNRTSFASQIDTMITAICIINAHQHFEFSIGNDEIMQKLPLKSVIFIRKVPFILHIAVQSFWTIGWRIPCRVCAEPR